MLIVRLQVTGDMLAKYLPAILTLQRDVRLISSPVIHVACNFLTVSESVSLKLNQISKFCPMLCSYRLWSIRKHFAVHPISFQQLWFWVCAFPLPLCNTNYTCIQLHEWILFATTFSFNYYVEWSANARVDENFRTWTQDMKEIAWIFTKFQAFRSYCFWRQVRWSPWETQNGARNVRMKSFQCKIWGFRKDYYKEYLLTYGTVKSGYQNFVGQCCLRLQNSKKGNSVKIYGYKKKTRMGLRAN